MKTSTKMKNWRHNEIRELLSLRADAEIARQIHGTASDSLVYDQITSLLRDRGVIRAKAQVVNKLKALKKQYFEVVDRNCRSGNDRKTWPHFILCKTIWGSDSANPVALVESTETPSRPTSSCPETPHSDVKTPVHETDVAINASVLSTVTLKDSQGAITLTATKDTVERLKHDRTFVAHILKQARGVGKQATTPPALTQCPPVARPPSGNTRGPPVARPPSANTQCSPPNIHIPWLKPASPQKQLGLYKQDFTHNTIMLLLELTKTHQHLYYLNKRAFYRKLEEEFRNHGYHFSNEKLRKKLGNMLITYKRAKDRSQTTGEGTRTWEYYVIMDDLFGPCGVWKAPPGTIVSTPLFPKKESSSATSSGQLPSFPEETPGPGAPEVPEEQPGCTTTLPSTVDTASMHRRGRISRPSFDESYEVHAERRTAALEAMVRPEQDRRRRLKERRRRAFETQLLTSLNQNTNQLLTSLSQNTNQLLTGFNQIANQLQEISSQQKTIITLLSSQSPDK